jgi:predicted transcriptional regulator
MRHVMEMVEGRERGLDESAKGLLAVKEENRKEVVKWQKERCL